MIRIMRVDLRRCNEVHDDLDQIIAVLMHLLFCGERRESRNLHVDHGICIMLKRSINLPLSIKWLIRWIVGHCALL
jgi:hypothetical protein